MNVGVVGNRENKIRPRAIEPTKKVMNLIKKKPISLLNMPIRHAIPMHKLRPPYMPAISEQPTSEITDNPTATEKLGQPRSNAPATGSNRAQIPINEQIADINNKYSLIIQINLNTPYFFTKMII